AIGVLLAAAWAFEPATVVLFVVPALALHAAGRALVGAVGERRRLSAGAAASRVLSRGSAADLAEYGAHLASAVGAAQVVLITAPGGDPVVVPQGARPDWLDEVLTRLDGDRAVALDPGGGPLSKVLAVRLPGRPGTLLALADPTGARERLATELAFLTAAASEVEAFVEAEGLRALADARLSRLETVVAAVAEGIVTVDAAGRVLAMNAAAGRITGRDPAGLGERALDELGLERPDGSPWRPDLRSRAVAERVQVRSGDGARAVDVSVAPAVLDDTPGAVLVLRDVTAAVEREQARRSFLVGLGHELRTPLTPLLGWAQTLQRRPEILDGPARAIVVEALGSQSQRLARLVDNLLTAVDPQTMVSSRRPVDLVELAEREVALAAPALGSRAVRVLAREPVVLTSSPAALSHVVGNLLSNVARYVPESGSTLVHVRREGGDAVLTVLDDGPGVPPERREAVFELFAHGALGEANPGAGVGLTTSRALARVLGGDLECVDPAGELVPDVVPVPRSSVRSTPGAAFRLRLPVTAPAPTGPATALAAQLFA
ncbi:MAG: ATP-binding protein, partial [Actinomycetota bacterium]|nr:ATP-binding protein [Actinomycetota bacterium]